MTDHELRMLLDEATPGCWECFPSGPKLSYFGPKRGHGKTLALHADARLGAAAVNALPGLLARIDELEKDVEHGKMERTMLRGLEVVGLRCAAFEEAAKVVERADDEFETWREVAAAIRALKER